MTNKLSSHEVVHELLRLISLPAFMREQREVDTVLPWLRKRSQLLQSQDKGVLQDIVKNCSLLSCARDDVIIKQGDRGDSFYIILRGSVSVYIDPKMTGEGGEDTASRSSAKKKKKPSKKLKDLEQEDSVLSGMEKPTSETADDGQEGAKEGDGEEGQEEEEEYEEEEVEEEDGIKRMKKKPTKALAPLDRNKFGKFIVSYGIGGAFGEVALVHKDLNRNASVITDEETDVMVIDQDLFDRSLRAEQEAKYAEIRNFIDVHPFFNQMNTKFKKLLEMSLRKETYIFDTNIIKQGDPIVGLHFIVSDNASVSIQPKKHQHQCPHLWSFGGNASVSIQPKKHQHQYPHLWPFEAGIDQLSIEFEHLREARRAAILRKYEDPSVWETKPEELVIRREQGYAAIERKMKENHINLCTVQTREVLGDVETLLNLSTYMQTVRCTANTQCFVLDTKNFERLVGKRNNPQTMDVMREYVKAKLHTRMNMRNADLIPFLGYLHQKLTEQLLPPIKKVEPFRMSKAVPDMDEEMQHLLQYFREGKDVILIKPSVPGVVYYREIMREKAKARECQRGKGSKDGIKMGSVTKSQPRRKPRSMLQIRESLRQMMEAEVIELETKKQKKKQRLKPVPAPDEYQLSDRSSKDHSPRTLISEQNKSEKRAKNSHAGTTNAIKPPNNKKDKETINNPSETLKDNPDLPKATPPVFVTELSKNPIEPALPVIREENSHDEIILPAQTSSPKPNTGRDANNNKEPKSSRKETSNGSKKQKAKKNKQAVSNEKQNGQSTPDKTVLPPIELSKSPRDMTRNGEDAVNQENGVPNMSGRLTDEPTERSEAVGEQVTGRTDESQTSTPWQTAMTFVNNRIKERLTKSLLEEESDYKDYETSEPSLKLLENRIQAFHVKYGGNQLGTKTKNLPNLKRYKLDMDEEERPKPGGKVWVKKQVCRFSDSEYVVKNHKHVRYKMVEAIPEFDSVRKSKVVLQQILKTADYDQ